MSFNLAQIQFEAARVVNQLGRQPLTATMDAAGQCPGGTLTVVWTVPTGGTVNPSTGAMVGEVATPWSGTLAAIAVEEGVRSVVRTYTEIGVGDLIVTLAGVPLVELCPGQPLSGSLPLSGVAVYGPQFIWAGNQYVQKQVTEDLRTLWAEAIGGVPVTLGVLLKRSA